MQSFVQTLVQSGRVVDIILLVMLAEAALVLYLLRARGMLSLAGMVGNLTAGASLVLALRLALQDAGWMPIAMLLLVALASHLVDLICRLATTSRQP